MHVHASALDFLIFGAYFVIWCFFWRILSARWHDRPLGKAMGALNS